jgi:integrase
VPAPVVQKAAGHVSLKTTERYIHLADSDLDVLIQRPANAKGNEKAG